MPTFQIFVLCLKLKDPYYIYNSNTSLKDRGVLSVHYSLNFSLQKQSVIFLNDIEIDDNVFLPLCSRSRRPC